MQQESTYAEAIKLKYPEQVVIAIARDPQGKYNPITLGWTMIASHDPPMMAIGVGKTRYSAETIPHAGEFVIAFPSEDQEEETMLFGTKSGRETDKIAESGVSTQPTTVIDGILLADAVANFECRLSGRMETGDHILFVGKVVAAHANERPLTRLYTVGAGHRMGGRSRV